jgi:CubicO group peptidase (beta-lactamase class C family)
MKDAIDKLVEPLFSTRKNMGVVVGILTQSENKTFGYGYISEKRQISSDATTIFEIGSITKVFTGALLASMVYDGLVQLDEPVRDLLPDVPNFPKEITLLHLATHTSGLPRLPRNIIWSMLRHPRNPYAAYNAKRLHAFLVKYRPRTHFTNYAPYTYSNLGVGLLGYVLARKLGVSYEEAIVSRICNPLGLSDTRITLTEEQRQRIAAPHTQKGKPTKNWDLSVLAGAGGLRSTSQDMLRFLAANVKPTQTPLAEIMEMFHVKHRTVSPPENGLVGIALNWHIIEQDDYEYYWHNGGTGGYQSFAAFNEDNKCGVVVLCNYRIDVKNMFIDQIGQDIFQLLMKKH